MAWEYMTFEADWRTVQSTLKRFAADGWELVSASTGLASDIAGEVGGQPVYHQRVRTWAILRGQTELTHNRPHVPQV
jgi:hypothetical protein